MTDSKKNSHRGALSQRGTLLPNLLTSVVSFVITLSIGVWYTPFLVGHLGTSSYGLVPLATTATSYLGLLTIALTHSLARFLTIAVEQDDIAEATRVFNTALIGGALLCLIIVLPASLLILVFKTIANVPPGAEQDVTTLFGLATASFIVGIIVTPFNIASFTRNRLDLRTTGEILANLIRVVTVVVFFKCMAPRLWQIGAGLLIAATFLAVYSIWTSRRLIPYLRVDIAKAKWATFTQMYRTSAWVIVDQLGAILSGGLDLLFANLLIGSQATGEYALVLQWSSLLRGLGGSITSVLAPSTLSHFAKNDIPALIRHTQSGMRLTGLCMALPVGLVWGFSSDILRLWIGVQFEHLSSIMRLAISPMSVFCAAVPLLYVLMAINSVKIPAIWTVGTGIFNCLLMYVFVGWLGWGLYGLVTASVIAQGGKTILFLPIYTSQQLGCSTSSFLYPVWSTVLGTATVATIAFLATHVYPHSSVVGLLCMMLCVSAVYLALAYSVLMNGADKRLLLDKVTIMMSKYLIQPTGV